MEAKVGRVGERSAGRRPRRSAVRTPKRRWRPWLGAGVGLLLLAVAIDLPLAYLGSGNATQQVHRADLVLAKYQQEGVPASALRPLHRELARVENQAWFSPTFWLQPRQATIASVRGSAQSRFAAAFAERRTTARSVLTQYRTFVAGNQVWLHQNQALLSPAWSAQLGKASTPAQLEGLSTRWKVTLTTVEAAAQAAEATDAAAVTLSASGLAGQATQAEALAKAAGLSDLQVPAALAALQKATAAGQPTTTASNSLAQQLLALRAEIGLQEELETARETLLGSVDQASFENVPNAATYQSQYTAAKTALASATDVAQLSVAQSGLQSDQGKVQAALAADGCGHSSIAGKAIYISLSLEEMVFYDNGCAVNATPVTTGRPGETTPTGTFSVYVKASPLEFVSGYAPGSPNYYTPFLASYGMEFLSGGYYIHNAPWEPLDAFGPGSQDDLADASHGCVHTPLAALAWAYSWTSYGTPVVISA
jgi:lipoprotein-anchoring transpeptidase ErfK/SrfK